MKLVTPKDMNPNDSIKAKASSAHAKKEPLRSGANATERINWPKTSPVAIAHPAKGVIAIPAAISFAAFTNSIRLVGLGSSNYK